MNIFVFCCCCCFSICTRIELLFFLSSFLPLRSLNDTGISFQMTFVCCSSCCSLHHDVAYIIKGDSQRIKKNFHMVRCDCSIRDSFCIPHFRCRTITTTAASLTLSTRDRRAANDDYDDEKKLGCRILCQALASFLFCCCNDCHFAPNVSSAAVGKKAGRDDMRTLNPACIRYKCNKKTKQRSNDFLSMRITSVI